MIEHVSVRCSDSRRSRKFYERVLEPLGYVCDMKYGDSFGFKDEAGRHDFWVTPGDVGTPTHLAFLARSSEDIDRFHAAGLKAGGTDNGGPGPRKGYAAFAAFVIDPDGQRGPMKMHVTVLAVRSGTEWRWQDLRAFGFMPRPPDVH